MAGSAEGPQGQSMGMSWTDVCPAIALFHGGWMPVRRGTGNDEQWVVFKSGGAKDKYLETCSTFSIFDATKIVAL